MRAGIVDLMKLVAFAAVGAAAIAPFHRATATGNSDPWMVLAMGAIAVPLVWVPLVFLFYTRGGRRDAAALGLLLAAVTATIVFFAIMSVRVGVDWWNKGGMTPVDPWVLFPPSIVALMLPAWLFLAVRLERRLNRNRLESVRLESVRRGEHHGGSIPSHDRAPHE